jgi:purine-nucleoside/S-methyl-5'-thioadenosine phosphorylase / adenosine deaminase
MSGMGHDERLEAAALSALSGVRHAFFTRLGGVSKGIYASLNGGIGSNDEPGHVAENRARMAAALGVPAGHLLAAYQTHSAQVAIVDAPWDPHHRPRVDALVTRRPGLAVAVTTADCGPVLLADESARVVGAAHAGWRGAADGVIEATIVAMEDCGAKRERIVAALGPMIRQSSYEVGPEFVAAFRTQNAANERFFAPASRAGHALFDLATYIAVRLAAAGIRHIEDLGLCTYRDPARFFSYRRSSHCRESDYGRHINAIALTS